MATIKDDSLTTTLERQMFTRAGLGAGGFLGIVVGGTIWTHDMSDGIHLLAALLVLAFCITVGGVIGKWISGLDTESSR
jgi:prolipoprotein diacylglyceryltransferase